MVAQQLDIVNVDPSSHHISILEKRDCKKLYTPRNISKPRVHISTISIDNVEGKQVVAVPVEMDENGCISNDRCEVHGYECSGHLRTCNVNGTDVLIPPPDMCDLGSKDPSDLVILTLKLMRGVITPLDYVIAIRESLTGKRGALRHKCCSAQPNAGMRGVVVPHYSIEPDLVQMPINWLKSIRLLSDVHVVDTNCDYDDYTFSPNGDNIVDMCDTPTPYHDIYDPNVVIRRCEYRVIDGTYLNGAIISRAPAISYRSVQLVKINGWNQHCIGTHTALCEGLHMDYDGDEVHVHPIVSYDAVMEARRIKTDYLKKQAHGITSDKMCRMDIDFGNPCDHTSTTVPILSDTILSTLSYTVTPAHALFGHKKTDHEFMCKLTRGLGEMRRTFVSNARAAIVNNIESKLSVSQGYTYNRRMYTFTSTIRSTDNITSFATNLCTRIPRSLYMYISHPYINVKETEISCVLNEVMSPIMQRLLDMAKSKHTIQESVLLGYIYDDTKIKEIIGDMELAKAYKYLSVRTNDATKYYINSKYKRMIYYLSAQILNELGKRVKPKEVMLLSYALHAKFVISSNAISQVRRGRRCNTNLVSDEMSTFFSSGLLLPFTTMCMDSVHAISRMARSVDTISEDATSLVFRVITGNFKGITHA